MSLHVKKEQVTSTFSAILQPTPDPGIPCLLINSSFPRRVLALLDYVPKEDPEARPWLGFLNDPLDLWDHAMVAADTFPPLGEHPHSDHKSGDDYGMFGS